MMALADTSPRLFGTTAFRLAATTVAAFLAAAILIVIVILSQVNGLLTAQVITGLDAEKAELEAHVASADVAAIVDTVKARTRPDGA